MTIHPILFFIKLYLDGIVVPNLINPSQLYTKRYLRIFFSEKAKNYLITNIYLT